MDLDVKVVAGTENSNRTLSNRTNAELVEDVEK
jgi:hypothetical protein